MILTPEEKLLLEDLVSNGLNWDSEAFKDLKSKLKEGLIKHDRKCCYCAKDFKGEFKYVIDIEHILPKSIFNKQTFHLENLSIACKRCNMMIKKDKIDFLDLDLLQVAQYFKSESDEYKRLQYLKKFNHTLCQNEELNFKDKSFYKIIHPNFDNYYENLGISEIREDEKFFRKYNRKKPKGEYTYKYFRLEELEQSDLDVCQGIEFINDNLIFRLEKLI